MQIFKTTSEISLNPKARAKNRDIGVGSGYSERPPLLLWVAPTLTNLSSHEVMGGSSAYVNENSNGGAFTNAS